MPADVPKVSHVWKLAAALVVGVFLGFSAGVHWARVQARGYADGAIIVDVAPEHETATVRILSESTTCEPCAEDGGVGLPLMLSLPVILALVMLSGLFSGLTLGLMGLDMIALETVKQGGNEADARHAAKIIPVRAKGNQLLCTLLLGNVAVNSALSILTAEIASGTVGFFVSTGLIVIFGEILPQAACSRHALKVGAMTANLVTVLMLIFFLLAKPISVALDYMLGRDVGMIFSTGELMHMLKMQIALGAADEETGAMAQQVAEGALSFRDKTVGEVMTPVDDCYMLSSETRLGYDMILEIFRTGYSRIPVYGRNKNDYKGLLYSKDLMLADPEDEMKLGDFIAIFERRVESFFKHTPLVVVLAHFKKGNTHMGLVRDTNVESVVDPRFEICGVVTLEDVMEEILQAEIVDETDVYIDVDNRVKVSDGREKKSLSLEIFNPLWRSMRERLSRMEVAAISAHLGRTLFTVNSSMELSTRAIDWLVEVSEVQNRERKTPAGVEEPLAEDSLYQPGQETDVCILVLQGRVRMRVGRDGFHSEAGAFSVMARNALLLEHFTPDFGAWLSTLKVRVLLIRKAQFQEARELDLDKHALDTAISNVQSAAAGLPSLREAKRGSQLSRAPQKESV